MTLGALAVAAFGLTACGSSDDSSGSSTAAGEEGQQSEQIAVSFYNREVPFFQLLAEGIRKQAAEKGWDVQFSFANNNPEEQISQIENALVQDPDGLIMIPLDSEALVPPALEADDDGVPVVTLANALADPEASVTLVSASLEENGEKKAQWVADALGGKGEVAVVHGIRGLDFSEKQYEAEQEVFAKYPGIEFIDGPYVGGFSSDLGLEATQNLIVAHPDLDAIIYDNDDLALGGIRALRERGIEKGEVLIASTDGLEPGLEAVEAGELDFTLVQCAVEQGRLSIDAMAKAIAGEKQPKFIGAPLIPITPETVDKQRPKFEACNS